VNPRIRALYEAHVAHDLAARRGDALVLGLERDAAAVFAWLGEVPLEELLSRKQVLDIIERYVIELRISGGITELAGQMSQVVFASDAGRTTRLDEMLSPEAYEEFADKIASLDGARQQVLQLVAGTRALRAILARVVTTTLVRRLLRPATRARAARSSRAGTLLASLRARLEPALTRRLEPRLERYFESAAEQLLHEEVQLEELVPSDSVRALADEIWDTVARREVAELFAAIDSGDLEDFVVLGYECWLAFRKTPFFRTVCTQVVDMIFVKYGQGSAMAFVEDMGVTERMILDEVRRLYVPALEHAAATGLLERQIRARLEPFYRSPAMAAWLQEGAGEDPAQ